jgi:hypothetical protein
LQGRLRRLSLASFHRADDIVFDNDDDHSNYSRGRNNEISTALDVVNHVPTHDRSHIGINNGFDSLGHHSSHAELLSGSGVSGVGGAVVNSGSDITPMVIGDNGNTNAAGNGVSGVPPLQQQLQQQQQQKQQQGPQNQPPQRPLQPPRPPAQGGMRISDSNSNSSMQQTHELLRPDTRCSFAPIIDESAVDIERPIVEVYANQALIAFLKIIATLRRNKMVLREKLDSLMTHTTSKSGAADDGTESNMRSDFNVSKVYSICT